MDLRKSLKMACLTVFLYLISVFLYAAPLNPPEGIYYLSEIPRSQIHKTFCQSFPGEKGDITGWPDHERNAEIEICENALDPIRERLIALSKGETDVVIDEELIKNVAHNLCYVFNSDSGYRDGAIRHTLQPDSVQSASEFIDIAQYQFTLTGVRVDSWTPTSHAIRFPVSFKDFPPRFFPLPKGQHGLHGIEVAGLPAPLLSHYMLHLTEKINAELTELNGEELERQIIIYSKMILMAHPFENGNTRTSLLMMNFLRMAVGLKPYRVSLMPRMAEHSSSYIQGFMKHIN